MGRETIVINKDIPYQHKNSDLDLKRFSFKY